MKDLPFPLALVIAIIIGIIAFTISDNIRNKDKYSACQKDFKNNPYSFTKERLNDCKFLFYPDSANLTRRQAIEKVLNR